MKKIIQTMLCKDLNSLFEFKICIKLDSGISVLLLANETLQHADGSTLKISEAKLNMILSKFLEFSKTLYLFVLLSMS